MVSYKPVLIAGIILAAAGFIGVAITGPVVIRAAVLIQTLIYNPLQMSPNSIIPW